MTIGNAGGVELELNDRPLGRIGEKGEVVRLKLPRPDGGARLESQPAQKDEKPAGTGPA